MLIPADHIVRIVTAEGKTAGTGFYAHRDGLVVTCTHVADVAADADGRIRLVDAKTSKELWGTRIPEYSRPASKEDVTTIKLDDGAFCAERTVRYEVIDEPRSIDIECYGFPATNDRYGMPA